MLLNASIKTEKSAFYVHFYARLMSKATLCEVSVKTSFLNIANDIHFKYIHFLLILF